MATFKEQPQPRTFAPSKEDVLQNLQYFFVRSQPLKPHAPCALFLTPAHRLPLAASRERPSRPRSSRITYAATHLRPNRCPLLLTRCFLVRAQSEHHAMTYHFPDAYAGQNLSLIHI